MSSDPNDQFPLTPAHIRIGGPLTSFPQPDFNDISPQRLSAWQHAQQLRHHFWKPWHKKYLHHLMTRSKWEQNHSQYLKVGILVIIKKDNVPPLQWNKGRIIETHPGANGIVRVVTLKFGAGMCMRAAHKICPLFQEESVIKDSK